MEGLGIAWEVSVCLAVLSGCGHRIRFDGALFTFLHQNVPKSFKEGETGRGGLGAGVQGAQGLRLLLPRTLAYTRDQLFSNHPCGTVD